MTRRPSPGGDLTDENDILALLADAALLTGCAPPAPQAGAPATIRFVAEMGGTRFACGQSYRLGTPAQAATTKVRATDAATALPRGPNSRAGADVWSRILAALVVLAMDQPADGVGH